MPNAVFTLAPDFAVVPAAVLPEQLMSSRRIHAGLQPERRLMLAVLEDAIADFQRLGFATTPAGRREFLAARAWIELDGSDWSFSFAAICEALGLDAQGIRRALGVWLTRQRALPPAARTRIRHPFRRTNGLRTHARGRAPGTRITE